MSLFNVLDVSSSGLRAQSIRLNTVASNIANADSVSTTADGAYRSKQPIFSTLMRDSIEGSSFGVEVSGVVESRAAPIKQYAPEHPLANGEGYVFYSNVNAVEEMANMISASRSYQNNVEAMKTARQLLIHTLNIGR